MKKSRLIKMLTGTALALTCAMPVTTAYADVSDVYGDANCDGDVNMSDAVIIMQSLANPNKYGINGTDENAITQKGQYNADVYSRGDGVSTADALSIQKYLLKLIDKLPESYKDNGGEETPVADTVYIHLKNTSIEAEGENAEVKGSVVTITHSGTYMIDGTLDDGQINVNIPDETADAETVKIFLNGVNITGKSAPAILVTNAENTSINIVDGTENTISDGDTAYANGGAVIEAKDDITFKGGDEGTGILNIVANTQNAVSCNNDIKINGGIINIETLNETDKTDGISGKTSVTVKSGTLKVKAQGDGIKSSKGDIEISGGDIKVKAGNDAVQASTAIAISGGNVSAGGDRGFRLDEGGKLDITGGNVIATATDYQVNGNEKIDMSGSTQTIVLLDMAEEMTKDDVLKLGAEFDPAKKYSYALLSSADILKNENGLLYIADAPAEHDGGNVSFIPTDTIVNFKDVKATDTLTPPTDGPTPRDTMTLKLDGKNIISDAPSDAYCAS